MCSYEIMFWCCHLYTALQNHLNNLINGIEDEKDENTKLSESSSELQ